MAIRSALTGHLVLSTLHANDAVGTVIRLINMGIEPFLVCSSLSLAVAQRLVRVVCPSCREPFVPSQELLASLGLRPDEGGEVLFYRGTGCRRCKNTGYYGRTAIIEMLEMRQEIRDLVLGRALLEALRLVSQTSGNRVVERAILNSIDAIRNGSSIADSFRAEGIFPETLIQLIYSGEEAGELERMLNKGADFYEQQVEASTTTLTSVLEPLLIILVGGLVGIILICLFLPIFNLGKAIRGGRM